VLVGIDALLLVDGLVSTLALMATEPNELAAAKKSINIIL